MDITSTTLFTDNELFQYITNTLTPVIFLTFRSLRDGVPLHVLENMKKMSDAEVEEEAKRIEREVGNIDITRSITSCIQIHKYILNPDRPIEIHIDSRSNVIQFYYNFFRQMAILLLLDMSPLRSILQFKELVSSCTHLSIQKTSGLIETTSSYANKLYIKQKATNKNSYNEFYSLSSDKYYNDAYEPNELNTDCRSTTRSSTVYSSSNKKSEKSNKKSEKSEKSEIKTPVISIH